MSDAEFGALLSAVSGPRSFSLTNDQITALQAQIPSCAENLAFLLAALSYVSSHVARLSEGGMQFPEAINSIVDELDRDSRWGEKKSQAQTRFSALINNDTHQRFRKLQRLQTGFVPNAVGFATFVDLRPDFGEGDPVGIKGYLPIIQLRITTDSTDPAEKRFVFQVSEEALKELRKAMDRADQKLAALKDQSSIALQIIKM